MSDITESDWRVIRHVFGDLAYEEPHNHVDMLVTARSAVLTQYSGGKLSSRVAAELLGLRDSADLLIALGDAGLPMPQPSAEEVKEQAKTFSTLFRENKEAKIAAAMAVLDRVPDDPPDPGDEIPG